MKIYASIHVGSFGISLKVFEIVKGKRLKKVDEMRRHMNLSRDILLYGKLSKDNLLLVVDTLRDMKETITAYKTDDCDVYAGFALAEAANMATLVDQVRLATGMELVVLDNSRQRFIEYKALCSLTRFSDLIRERAVIVDVGGSGIQLTLFAKGKLITTQHISLGATTVWDSLRKVRQSSDYRKQLLQMIISKVETFYYTFLNEEPLKRLIIINNPIVSINQARKKSKEGVFSTVDYLKILSKTVKENSYNVTEGEEGEDIGDMRLSFLLLYRAILSTIPVDEVFVPPISLHEGMVSEYVYGKKLLPLPRDFDEDVLSASWTIAERYNSNPMHIKSLKELSEQLFDSIPRRHGLTVRHRLLLSVAALLHDCGRFISLSDEASSVYTIIRASEILGLTNQERAMIAWICLFYKDEVRPYEELSAEFSRDE
ncbi:MAG: hypothetical protein IJV04_08260, partial [Lachnospiraceae bacterium]|nr:hypothetical protein [Lachnospiraceae bacterium]